MTEWSAYARDAIRRAHLTVPADATLAERKAIVDAAYPFGERAMWPYKAWLKARKAYLRQYGYGPPLPLTALDLLPRDPVTGRPVI
jgi:hypothetical protein